MYTHSISFKKLKIYVPFGMGFAIVIYEVFRFLRFCLRIYTRQLGLQINNSREMMYTAP